MCLFSMAESHFYTGWLQDFWIISFLPDVGFSSLLALRINLCKFTDRKLELSGRLVWMAIFRQGVEASLSSGWNLISMCLFCRSCHDSSFKICPFWLQETWFLAAVAYDYLSAMTFMIQLMFSSLECEVMSAKFLCFSWTFDHLLAK